jgi:hypothetical protein
MRVNDRIYEIAVSQSSWKAEFLCECENIACRSFVSTTLKSYETLRAAGRFVRDGEHDTSDARTAA